MEDQRQRGEIENPDAAGISILLVGNRDMRAYLRQCLSAVSLPVNSLLVARSQKEAIQLCVNCQVDLAIVDMDQSHLKVLGFCNELHNLSEGRMMKILLLGGDRASRVKLKSTADGLLGKPFNSSRLVQTIERLLRQ